ARGHGDGRLRGQRTGRRRLRVRTRLRGQHVRARRAVVPNRTARPGPPGGVRALLGRVSGGGRAVRGERGGGAAPAVLVVGDRTRGRGRRPTRGVLRLDPTHGPGRRGVRGDALADR